MKRSPLKRKSPLRRGKRINPKNEERAAARRERDFGELADYVRTLKCCACEHPSPSQACHVKSRGAGGHAVLENGDGNLIAMCAWCHRKQHDQGWGAVFRYGRPHAESIAKSTERDFRLKKSEKSGNESGLPW